MRGWFERCAAAVALTGVLACVGCQESATSSASSAPATSIVVSIPFGGAWEQIGRAVTAEYGRRVPGLSAEAMMAKSLEAQADGIQAGSVDVALQDAESAYLAYTRGTASEPSAHDGLRAIAVMFSIAVQVAVPESSGITSFEQLKGKRVDVGAPGSAVDRAARIILASHGLSYEQVQPTFGASDALEQFKSGAVDARFFYSAFKHPTIEAISKDVDVRVLPIDRSRLGAIQEQHHFLKLTTIPAGTYPHQREDIQTVGMDVLLLCRRGLPDSLVYALTKALFESVPALERAHEAAGAIDVERAPTASIPLHPGAARFYREREILQ